MTEAADSSNATSNTLSMENSVNITVTIAYSVAL